MMRNQSLFIKRWLVCNEQCAQLPGLIKGGDRPAKRHRTFHSLVLCHTSSVSLSIIMSILFIMFFVVSLLLAKAIRMLIQWTKYFQVVTKRASDPRLADIHIYMLLYKNLQVCG